jgi:uncharacterized protein (UPF0335 family)
VSDAAAPGEATDETARANVQAAAVEHLEAHIERIERLRDERAALTAEIREAYAAAKSAGFERRGIDHVITQRALAPADRLERAGLLATYAVAMGLEVDSAADLLEMQRARAERALAAHAEAVAAGAQLKRRKSRAAAERALREMARAAGVLPGQINQESVA